MEIIDEKSNIYPRIILGLDISTACIGVCIVKDNGVDKPEILYLSHKTPKISRKIKGIEALFLRKKIFEEEFINEISTKYEITDVVIEEPLLSSNNVNTVATLLRFNGMISEAIYRIIGVVPNFISSYDARMYSFPELVAVRKYNKKGEEYSLKHVNDALKKDNIVLFGAYPFDVDKKTVMMNMVNEMYEEEGISWVLNKNGELKKENYDACDALICALAYINVNHHGVEKPTIDNFNKEETDEEIIITYSTKIWDRIYKKTLRLKK
jgi:Holliday junction resolvasome RuvABC endonuclease subunit